MIMCKIAELEQTVIVTEYEKDKVSRNYCELKDQHAKIEKESQEEVEIMEVKVKEEVNTRKKFKEEYKKKIERKEEEWMKKKEGREDEVRVLEALIEEELGMSVAQN